MSKAGLIVFFCLVGAITLLNGVPALIGIKKIEERIDNFKPVVVVTQIVPTPTNTPAPTVVPTVYKFNNIYKPFTPTPVGK